MCRVQSLESGKEADVSIWKKRAEAAEKALSNKEREILDSREVVSYFSEPHIAKCYITGNFGRNLFWSIAEVCGIWRILLWQLDKLVPK